MKGQWLSHLNKDPDKKDEFRKHLLKCKEGFSRLETLLDNMFESEQDKLLGMSDFATPNWAEKQAYRNGRLQAYRDIKQLLDGLT